LRTGLRGSIRDRSDFEYARVLAGISNAPERAVGMGFPEASRTPVDPAHIASSATSTPTKELAVVTEGDKRWWRSDGWCEVPVTEEYVSFLYHCSTSIVSRTDLLTDLHGTLLPMYI
jgi:hypothetical protein